MTEKKKTLVQSIVEDILSKATPDQIAKANMGVLDTKGQFEKLVRIKVHKMSPQVLGRIGAQGKGYPNKQGTSLYEVRLDEWPKNTSSRTLLRELAFATLIAAIYDELKRRSRHAV